MGADTEEGKSEHLSPEGIWEIARKFHEEIYGGIKEPGDAIAVVGVILTNMLIAGRVAGVPEDFIDHVLKTIKQDIESGVKQVSAPETLN